MLSLTRKTDYAIIALVHLARTVGEVCTAREIAMKFHVPAALLMNVLKTLCQGEVVRSVRGARGGYVLARPVDRINLAEIVTIVEGPIRLAQCTGSQHSKDSVCDLEDVCPVKRPVQRIHARLELFLRQITLADLLRDSHEATTNLELPLHHEGVYPVVCCSTGLSACREGTKHG